MMIRNHARLVLALSLVGLTVGAVMAPAIAQGLDLFFGTPRQVCVSNNDTEISTPAIAVAASLTCSFRKAHTLIIQFSAVGAVSGNLTLMYLGCLVNGGPCVGHQTDPGTIPAGYVNVLSNNYPITAKWDNTVGYTWLAPSPLGTSLPGGTDTVVITVAVGSALGCAPFTPGCGGPGTAFIEARNLVVTVTS